MILKKHINEGRLILALCDDSLIGKKIEDKGIILDLSSAFYKGEKSDDKNTLSLIGKAYLVNAVGEETIAFLSGLDFVSEKDIRRVKNVPYVHIVFEEKRH